MPGAANTRRLFLSHAAAAGLAVCQSLSGSPQPLNSLRRGHPRLILRDSDLALVRAISREHPVARRLLSDLTREAEKMIGAPALEEKLGGARPTVQRRRALERIYTLALLARLENQPRFEQRAVKELLALAAFQSWSGPQFLDTAEILHAVALGYDWLYSSLAESERAMLRTALVDKGLRAAAAAYAEPAPWVNSSNHWNLVSNSAVITGALAVADEEPELAANLFARALDSVGRAIATYAPDGAWPEGPGFWNLATRFLVILLSSLETAIDSDLGLASAKGVDRTGRYRIYTTGPSSRTFNFGDATDEAGTAPEMFWLARRFNQPVYSWHEQKEIDRAPHPDAADLIWFYREARSPQADNWPLDAFFPGAQIATMRTAWDDPDALFLGVKGGDNRDLHAHLDLGSFVLDGGGVRWAYDPGPEDPGEPGYFGKQRFSYFKARTEAHNTLLIDGENQDRHAEARITRREFAPGMSWVQIELKAAYPGKLKQMQRRIGLVQGQAVLVEDSLQADQPVEALWGMMTDAAVTFSGQTAELEKGGWTLSAEIRTPHHAVFDVVTNANTKKLVVRVGPKITELDLRVVLALHRTGQPKPKITAQFPA